MILFLVDLRFMVRKKERKKEAKCSLACSLLSNVNRPEIILFAMNCCSIVTKAEFDTLRIKSADLKPFVWT